MSENQVDREIIWNFCVLRLLYYTRSLLIIHFTSFDVQRRLPKFYSIHNKGQSWHFMNGHSRMVEIIGIRNYALHQRHSMNQYQAINWIFCDKMRFQTCTYLTINELIFPWARCWSVSHDDQRWITLRSEAEMRVLAIYLYFTICKRADHIQTV